jgi:2-oxoglutarate ferredoxin oxidoreductase subunit beta
VALGANATFVARTHDLDRKHMIDVFRQAKEHRGASLIEIYQNCNVFNDGAYDPILKRDNRPEMMVNLVHGERITFGAEDQRGIVIRDGKAIAVDIADVDESELVVHDKSAEDPALAFALGNLSNDNFTPTPFGVFRAVEAPEYGEAVNGQLLAANEESGPGDLGDLLRSGATWIVE